MAATIISDDVGEPEGPAFAPDGTFYVTEMARGRSRVSRIGGDGATQPVLATAGRPNGLAIDGGGDLWIAEAREGAVLRVAADGTIKARIAGDADGRFAWPNDLAFGPDGMLYLTDSGIDDLELIPDGGMVEAFGALAYDGRLYRIDPASGRVELLDRGFRFTNGIAFGPDDRLYINETLTGHVYHYDLSTAQPARETFGNVLKDRSGARFAGPDGMKFDREGFLYCAVYGQGDVTVLDPQGAVADRLPAAGSSPTNLAFHPDRPCIYVTEVASGTVTSLEVPRGGLPLHMPRIPG